jgi:uncharacterized protein YcbX
MSDADPYLAHLQIFPIKALGRETPERTVVGPTGALAHDRRWAIVDAPAGDPHDPDRASVRSDYVNGKATDEVHRLRSTFDPEGPTVTFEAGGQRQQFALGPASDGDSADAGADREAINDWLSAYFDRPVSLRHAAEPGMPDRRHLGGPTVISTATLREVADWVDINLESARRRFRANVEIGGVPAFWEDRLYGDDGEVVRFRVGDAVLEGVSPCGRCVTPTRDPETGAVTPEFRKRFIERRRETAPPWTESERFEHYYTLAVTTRAARSAPGDESATEATPIELGDDVALLGTVEA